MYVTANYKQPKEKQKSPVNYQSCTSKLLACNWKRSSNANFSGRIHIIIDFPEANDSKH